jgi:perosamine synthetase
LEVEVVPIKSIRSFYPNIEESDVESVIDATRNGWGDKRYQYIDMMEAQLAQITNQEFAIAVSHGTAAITLALASLDLNSGDEVIVPDLTWVACAAPIIQLGLTPVFVNVDDSLCIMPESFEKAITNRTRAVIVVDLAGSLPDWERINLIARNHGIFVIEDAAESLGGKYKGMPAGQFGDISVLSFSGTKVVTGGHGGAVLTSNPELHKKMKLLYHHGINQVLTGKYYWSHVLGYNFQISNIQAALISSQLKRLNSLVEYKRKIFGNYKDLLSDCSGLTIVESPSSVLSSHWLIVARISKELNIDKEKLVRLASNEYVDIRPFFYLLSEMPPFQSYYVEREFGRLETSEISRMSICLPYGYDLNSEALERIVKVLKKVSKANVS